MLSIHSLALAVNERILFKNFSATFLPAAITYINGGNGCGKTSFLRIIAQIQKPSQGKITFGKKSIPISRFSLPYCTYIGHKLAINHELTVIENITFWAKAYNAEILIQAAISYLNLYDIIEEKCHRLSEGNLKKVALARLLVCRSKIWLLDEIETNLDKKNRELLSKLIVSHADNGGLAFIASHHEPSIKTAKIINLPEYA